MLPAHSVSSTLRVQTSKCFVTGVAHTWAFGNQPKPGELLQDQNCAMLIVIYSALGKHSTYVGGTKQNFVLTFQEYSQETPG